MLYRIPHKAHFIHLIQSKKKFIMRDLISLIIVVLLGGWLIGFIGFGEAVGNLIHILLVFAVIGILYRLATGSRL